MRIAWGIVGLCFFISCQKSETAEEAASPTASSTVGGSGIGSGITQGAENALAAAFPATLAISLFPQSVDDGAALLEDAVDDPNADKTVREKSAEQIERLNGEGSCLDRNMFGSLKDIQPVTCYEFDSDMNPSRFAGQEREFGTVDGTNGDGEACMVSFARAQVTETVRRVDRALALVAGMLCKAKQDGEAEAMVVDEERDLLEGFSDAAGAKMAVSEAKITRLADSDAGEEVYLSSLVITLPDGEDMTVHLKNVASETSKTGVLSILRPGRAQPGMQQDPNNEVNKIHALSIEYDLSTSSEESHSKGELRHAALESSIDALDANGLVNFADLPDEASNSVVHAIKYLSFDVDPATNAGTMSYWMNPGGSLQESARGFLFDMSANEETGVLAGCGVSGATANISIRKALVDPSEENALKPVRFWHPRGSSNIHPDKDDRYVGQEGFMVTEQCFKQDAEGVYAVDADKTTDARGYEVIERDAVDILPPPRPRPMAAE
jgi:hypothetical protein